MIKDYKTNLKTLTIYQKPNQNQKPLKLKDILMTIKQKINSKNLTLKATRKKLFKLFNIKTEQHKNKIFPKKDVSKLPTLKEENK